MKLYITVYNLSIYWETECFKGKKKSRDIIATFATPDFRDLLFPQQFVLWLIFQPRWKCNYGSFLHFKHSTSFSSWVFFGFVVTNCKIFVQLSALFRKISPPLKLFATLKSCNILIFKSSWLSIPTTFCLQVAEKLLWLS